MIDIELIKRLREETGCGVIEAKKALEDSATYGEAVKTLKEQGLAKSQKKEGREVLQGKVVSYIHNEGKIGAIVLLGCETDFVARTEDFGKLALEISMQVAAMNPENVESLLSQEYIRDSSKTIKDLLVDLTAKVGENIVVKDFKRLEV